MRPGRRSGARAIGLWLLLTVLAGSVLTSAGQQPPAADTAGTWALVIHGGAGTILRENLTPEAEQEYEAALTAALDTGAAVLAAGGTSLDAVEAAIRFMEDSPLFNAGRGSVFTEAGVNEMDAAIMDGRDRAAGAVAGVKTLRHPISAARAVMEKSEHVMLAREGAESFAAEHGLEVVDPAWLRTEARWQSYLKALADREAAKPAEPDRKHGTVGCVALDQAGNLAAGTSTGGMTLKMWGRIGDAPVIGAGTFADNRTCGVSATGHGEFFIRNVVAYDIAALMEYAGLPLQEAAERVVSRKLVAQGASGGIVALDAAGNIALVFNTPGMYRGFRKSDGSSDVAIFGP